MHQCQRMQQSQRESPYCLMWVPFLLTHIGEIFLVWFLQNTLAMAKSGCSGFASSICWMFHEHMLQHGSCTVLWLHGNCGQPQGPLPHPYPLPTLSETLCRHTSVTPCQRSLHFSVLTSASVLVTAPHSHFLARTPDLFLLHRVNETRFPLLPILRQQE